MQSNWVKAGLKIWTVLVDSFIPLTTPHTKIVWIFGFIKILFLLSTNRLDKIYSVEMYVNKLKENKYDIMNNLTLNVFGDFGSTGEIKLKVRELFSKSWHLCVLSNIVILNKIAQVQAFVEQLEQVEQANTAKRRPPERVEAIQRASKPRRDRPAQSGSLLLSFQVVKLGRHTQNKVDV